MFYTIMILYGYTQLDFAKPSKTMILMSNDDKRKFQVRQNLSNLITCTRNVRFTHIHSHPMHEAQL